MSRRRNDAELVTLTATLQDHRATREAWGAGTILIHSAEGDLPFGAAVGAEVSASGGNLGLAAPGERLELRGEWENGRYGLQFKIQEQGSQGVANPTDAARWLTRLDGVGPKRARALAQHFGDRLVAVLSGEEESDLTAVPGIGAAAADHIRESFAGLAIAGDLETVRYLDGIGASRYEVTKIIAWCSRTRAKPREVLEEAPYSLMAIKGLGFARVDRISKAAGCPAEAPARLEAAAVHVLGQIVQQGSTMVRLRGGRGGGLVGETATLLGLGKEPVGAAVRRLAGSGEVVLADDERGQTWVHPAELLQAEREIYRAALGGARRKNTKEGSNHALTEQHAPGGGLTPAEGIPPGTRVPNPLQPTYRRRAGEAEPADLVPRLAEALELTAAAAEAAKQPTTRGERVEALLDLVADGATQEDW